MFNDKYKQKKREQKERTFWLCSVKHRVDFTETNRPVLLMKSKVGLSRQLSAYSEQDKSYRAKFTSETQKSCKLLSSQDDTHNRTKVGNTTVSPKVCTAKNGFNSATGRAVIDVAIKKQRTNKFEKLERS